MYYFPTYVVNLLREMSARVGDGDAEEIILGGIFPRVDADCGHIAQEPLAQRISYFFTVAFLRLLDLSYPAKDESHHLGNLFGPFVFGSICCRYCHQGMFLQTINRFNGLFSANYDVCIVTRLSFPHRSHTGL